MDPREKLRAIDKSIRKCTRCGLCEHRRNSIVNEHPPTARLMILCEPQGGFDRHSGFPPSGTAGRMLNRMIQVAGLRRTDVFIESITKCVLPRTRGATESELDACFPYTCQQIEAVKPSVICTMGTAATHKLLGTSDPLSRLHGKTFLLEDFEEAEIWVVPTYHPDVLLRNPQRKEAAWDDMRVVRKQLRRAAARIIESDRA